MLIPLKDFIEGHRTPRTVTLNTTVREALAIMRNNDYSQLPIVDDQGYIKGMISEQSIVNTYFDLNGSLNLQFNTVAIPEPSSALLLLTGMGLVLLRRIRTPRS